jgi:hypothetical protein
MRWKAPFPALMVFATAGWAATSPPCATCHPQEAAAHARTQMASAMVPALASAFAENLPDHPLREPNDGYQIFYKRTNKGIAVTAIRADDRADGLIEWVFGSGQVGQTPVVRTPAGLLESHVSYFPQIHRYGITVGHQAGASPTAQAALGLKQNPDDLRKCFGCHATTVASNLTPIVPGVQCERCHPGASDHAVGRGKPLNPGKMQPTAQVQFCGACHRVKTQGKDSGLENIRFQPLRLMKSRCYASGKLACTTCHQAHQDARRNDPAYYNQKCHTCHAAGQNAMHTDARQTGNCIGCHMPQVQLHPALRFTDHFIRVVESREARERAN